MTAVAEYRILSAPRFAADEMDMRLFDSFVGQRALWAHLALNLVDACNLTVEYRIAHFDEIVLSIRLHGELTPKALRRIAEAEAMLPPGYKWRRVEPDHSVDQQRLWCARVARRLEFVDLPVPNADLRPATEESISLFGLPPIGRELKQLPNEDTILNDLFHERFCLPLPGSVDAAKPRVRALFQEIQREAPVVVSICLYPLDREEHWHNQLHALAWKRFLDPFAGTLASAGFADAHALRSAYDRFSLPPGHLLHASIRVGGGSDRIAVGVGNTVAAAFGGFRAFQVHPPTTEVPGALLCDRAMDVPALWTPGQRKGQYKWLREQLEMARIADLAQGEEREGGDATRDFLLRASHLYTLDEIEQLMRLPIADEEGLPGFTTELMPPFVVPSLSLLPVQQTDGTIAPPPANRFRVGMLRRPGSTLTRAGERFEGHGWHTIDPVDLTKHALVVGSTGSGKTMSTLFMAREIDRLGIPLMVIEPVKTEYYGRLQGKIAGLERRRFESGSDGKPSKNFMAFDPMRIPRNVSVMRHVSYIKSCFEAAFPLSPLLSLLLENGLIEYYTGRVSDGCCGFPKFQRGGPQLGSIRPDGSIFPSFDTFQKFLLGTFIDRAFSATLGRGSSQSEEFRDIFRRRFVNLGAGTLGTSFRIADAVYRQGARASGAPRDQDYDLLESLLDGPVVIELDAIADAEQKALVMAFLLTYIFEHRQAEDLGAREAGGALPSELRHFIILEEAHRLLATSAESVGRGEDTAGLSSQAKAVGLFVDMLAEIRAFGQGIAVVEQIPTKIVSDAVKNTNLKIMLRLTARDDREYLGSAMNFTDAQQRFVTGLRIDKPRYDECVDGQVNFVMFEEGVEHPLLLGLPLIASADTGPQSDWLYDEFF